MIPAPRTFWMMGIVVMFVVGMSGCGEKRLSGSTSSGKANEQEKLEASIQDTPSAPTGIQDSSISETGLGSTTASQDSTTQAAAATIEVEPPPVPSLHREATEGFLETPETDDATLVAGSAEEMQRPSPSGSAEDLPTPSAYQTAMEPSADSSNTGDGFQSGGSGNGLESAGHENGLENSGSEDQAFIHPVDSLETNEAGFPPSASTEEEFGALAQGTEDGGAMEATHIEREPENIVVAKVEPSDTSDAIEQQLARIKEGEMALATESITDVFFEFDSWKITDQGKDVLEKNANLLHEDTDMSVLIEGHCDQRGTQAYNIVLGKKRAMAIRDYLVALGVDSSRLSVITYGKEKLDCTDQTELCYQKNRRGHFVLQ